ncbi:MAG: DUF1080 domain-containing protein [Planctomycetales bacterium]|nr:DUF1080 domain-containing protein [Planctomycetales bacterium]
MARLISRLGAGLALVCLATALRADEPPALLTQQQIDDGWIALFDGHSLFGWQAHSEANFRVEDGTIVVDDGPKGLLCTTTRFQDYELHLEFRAAAGTNSGVFLRTPGKPTNPSSDCYELNIAPADNPFPTGSLVGRKQATGFVRDGQWQTFDVVVDGAKVRVQVDGKQALEYLDPAPLSGGFIGLQKNEGKVEFRNVRLRPLGGKPIFNGKDLAGWKTYPEMQSKFQVDKPGELHVLDGRGQLETSELYGDFVFQMECISHAPSLNSGIFFRCIPGETMNGYESQIHNGFKDGDRTQPVDCGTGGIYRRKNARRVVADDLKWFAMTLIADGPHFSIWVNGYQVTDWTDERKPDDNPRRGLRTAPGSIMIQGHDPTTDLSFRKLRIQTLGK